MKRHTSKLGDEQGQTDTNGRQEGRLGLLGRQHQDGDEQFGGQEHLDEQALRGRGAVVEHRLDDKRAGEEGGDDGGGDDAGDHLRDEEEEASDPGERAADAHSQSHLKYIG